MTVSTRGRYALRVMLDLAQQGNKTYTPMKDVAQRQGLSLKYLERILPVLTKHQMIEGIHGRGGGYRLCKAPEEYRLWDILVLTESDLAPVACLENGALPCPRADSCLTLPLWKEFYEEMRAFFSLRTLADLLSPSSLREEQ